MFPGYLPFLVPVLSFKAALLAAASAAFLLLLTAAFMAIFQKFAR